MRRPRNSRPASAVLMGAGSARRRDAAGAAAPATDMKAATKSSTGRDAPGGTSPERSESKASKNQSGSIAYSAAATSVSVVPAGGSPIAPRSNHSRRRAESSSASSSRTSAHRAASDRSVRPGTVAMGVLLLCWTHVKLYARSLRFPTRDAMSPPTPPALTLPRARVYHFRLKRSELRRPDRAHARRHRTQPRPGHHRPGPAPTPRGPHPERPNVPRLRRHLLQHEGRVRRADARPARAPLAATVARAGLARRGRHG